MGPLAAGSQITSIGFSPGLIVFRSACRDLSERVSNALGDDGAATLRVNTAMERKILAHRSTIVRSLGAHFLQESD